jgi:hypothetical protein
VLFAPKCFGPLAGIKVPLLHEHEGKPVGSIVLLSYRERDAALLVRAEVECRIAQCAPAFSIGCHIRDYVIHNPDSPAFRAEVTAAELTDISLTRSPFNPAALVLSRGPVPPPVAFHSLLIAKVGVMIRITEVLKEMASATVPPPAEHGERVTSAGKTAAIEPPAAHGDDEGDDARLRAWLTRGPRPGAAVPQPRGRGGREHDAR